MDQEHGQHSTVTLTSDWEGRRPPRHDEQLPMEWMEAWNWLERTDGGFVLLQSSGSGEASGIHCLTEDWQV